MDYGEFMARQRAREKEWGAVLGGFIVGFLADHFAGGYYLAAFGIGIAVCFVLLNLVRD